MEPKEFDIEFPRGDTLPIRFKLKDYFGTVLTPTVSTEIYFTLKTNSNSTSVILQKKYSTGDIYLEGDYIVVYFFHTDTTSLKMNTNYEYDIEVIDGDYVKTLYLGKFRLTSEVTHLADE